MSTRRDKEVTANKRIGRSILEEIVIKELRWLRGSADRYSPAKLTDCPMTLFFLGSNDVARAEKHLLALAHEFKDDKNVEAALAAIGFTSDRDNVLKRMSDYGEHIAFVDERTVRRRSDLGIEVLARAVTTSSRIHHPLCAVEVWVDRDDLFFDVEFKQLDGVGMSRPAIFLNGATIDSSDFRTSVNMKDGRNAVFDIGWGGEMAARYVARVNLPDSIVSEVSVHLDYFRVIVDWSSLSEA